MRGVLLCILLVVHAALPFAAAAKHILEIEWQALPVAAEAVVGSARAPPALVLKLQRWAATGGLGGGVSEVARLAARDGARAAARRLAAQRRSLGRTFRPYIAPPFPPAPPPLPPEPDCACAMFSNQVFNGVPAGVCLALLPAHPSEPACLPGENWQIHLWKVSG